MRKVTYIILHILILTSCMKETTIERKFSTQMKGRYGNGVTDIDGNKYKTTIIGTQEWMAENLKVSKYNDGTTIPKVTDYTWSQLKSGAWCYYNNNEINNTDYGKLYNWYVVNQLGNGNKNVCPSGFHIPTKNEWQVLINYLEQDSVFAGGQMKEAGSTHWNTNTYYNSENTNISLFTALPGGERYNASYYQGSKGKWWSSTESSKNEAWSIEIHSESTYVGFGNPDSKTYGYSIRCIKD